MGFYYETDTVNSEEYGKVNHSRIEKENQGNIMKVDYEEGQKFFGKVYLHWCKKNSYSEN